MSGVFVLALARQEGLEPPAYCLEGSCSIRLSYWRIFLPSRKLERVKGIEPSYPAWKAGILPLNYTRKPEHNNTGWVGCQDLSEKNLPPAHLFFVFFSEAQLW